MTQMKWPWHEFGLAEQPDEAQRIVAAIQEVAGDTSLQFVALARDRNSLKVAVAGLPSPLDAAAKDRIRLKLGLGSFELILWASEPRKIVACAFQPAKVDQVILYETLGRAIAVVQADQVDLARGDSGRNARLASKLCCWDIEIMTADNLRAAIDDAIVAFRELDGVTGALAQRLVDSGYLSYDDLSVIAPVILREMGNLDAEQANAIVEQAEERSEM